MVHKNDGLTKEVIDFIIYLHLRVKKVTVIEFAYGKNHHCQIEAKKSKSCKVKNFDSFSEFVIFFLIFGVNTPLDTQHFDDKIIQRVSDKHHQDNLN